MRAWIEKAGLEAFDLRPTRPILTHPKGLGKAQTTVSLGQSPKIGSTPRSYRPGAQTHLSRQRKSLVPMLYQRSTVKAKSLYSSPRRQFLHKQQSRVR
jgi:hypothetical protein